MVFEVYLKEEIGNQIGAILEISLKKFSVGNLDISNGLLTKGPYKIPVEHILFIKEV